MINVILIASFLLVHRIIVDYSSRDAGKYVGNIEVWTRMRVVLQRRDQIF